MKRENVVFIIAGSVLLIILAFFLGFFSGKSAQKKIIKQQEEEKKYHVDVYVIKQRLDAVSELATQKLTYEGFIPFEKGKIPFLTKKKGFMDYKAEIKAGIDMKNVDVKEQGDKVIITLPKSEVFGIYIDHDSLEFRDENFALFNWDKKEDVKDILVEAEDAVRENADFDKLLSEADKHAKDLITGLYADLIEEGVVKVR